MKNKLHKAVDEILTGISDWLIQQNQDLILAEDVENYEECESIQASITNFLEVNSEILFMSGAFKDDKTQQDILEALIKENEFIFNELKLTKDETI